MASVRWTGAAGDRQWTTAGNWSGDAVPGVGDDVVIGADAGSIIFYNSVGTLGSLTLDVTDSLTFIGSNGSTVAITGALNAPGTIVVSNGGKLSLSGSASALIGALTVNYPASADFGSRNASIGSLTLNGGTVSGSGTITAADYSVLNGGTEAGFGTVVLTGNGTLLSANYLEIKGTLSNQGTLAAHDLESDKAGDATLVNFAGATLDLNPGNDDRTGSYVDVTNAGLIVVAGGTSTATINGFLHDTGTVDIQAGTFDINSGVSATGALFKGPGELQISYSPSIAIDRTSTIETQDFALNGALAFAGSYNVSGTTDLFGGTLDLSAATIANNTLATVSVGSGSLLFGAQSLAIGSLSQEGGSISGSGTLTVDGAFLTDVSGSATQKGTGTTRLLGDTAFVRLALQNGRTLVNDGSLALDDGSSAITIDTTSRFVNAATGTVHLGATDHPLLYDFATSQGIFENDGLVLASPTSGATTAMMVQTAIVNAGTIAVTGGMLDTLEDITGSGTLTVASGATLDLGDADTSYNQSVTARGQTVDFTGSGGVLTLQYAREFSGQFGELQAGDTIILSEGYLNGYQINGATFDPVHSLIDVSTRAGTLTFAAPDLADADFVVNGPTLIVKDARMRADITWTGAGDGRHWGDAGNWSPRAPQDYDRVSDTLAAANTVTFDTGAATQQSLTFGGGDSLLVSGGTLITENGATIGGALIVDGGTLSATAALGELASNIVVAGGITVSAGALKTQAGGSVIAGGVLTVAAGALLSTSNISATTLDNESQIVVSGGSLAIAPSTTVTGSGDITLNSGTLSAAGVAASQTVIFGAGVSTLDVSGTLFAGRILGFAGYDAIDLKGDAKASATLDASGHIVFGVAGGGTATLDTVGIASGSTLYIASDGAGGTLLSLRELGNQTVPTRAAHGAGDVHIQTFSNALFNFQQAGQFTLVETTGTSGVVTPFQIQIATRPYVVNPEADVSYEVAIGVGGHIIDFDVDRGDADLLQVDGRTQTSSTTIGQTTLLVLGANDWQIDLSDGVLIGVHHGLARNLDVYVTLPSSISRGGVNGLLGDDSGLPGDELTDANGTPFSAPLSQQTLYGAFAQAWTVTPASSILSGGGAHTSSARSLFSTGLRSHALAAQASAAPPGFDINSLPADVLGAAMQRAQAAGITDPAALHDAVFDYAVTGDPGFIDGAVTEQQQDAGNTGTITTTSVTTPAITPVVGVAADAAEVTETASGATVTFRVYTTSPAQNDLQLRYSVVAPDGTFVDPASLGAAATGTVTIAAGQTSATFGVAVPAFADAASRSLRVQVSTADTSVNLVGETAQTQIDNPAPVAGIAATPDFALASGNGVLTHVGAAYTLDLGTIAQGSAANPVTLALSNGGGAGANLLAGSFAMQGSGFLLSGALPFSQLGPAGTRQFAVYADISANGAHSETVMLTGTQSNASGYSAPANASLTVTDVVMCFAAGTRISTPGGMRAVEALRPGMSVRTADGGVRPVRWIGRRVVECVRHPRPASVLPVRVRAGSFGPGCPGRDVWLSPEHAVLIDGALLPVRHLIDGDRIVQQPVSRITYYHVELDEHDVLLAEGLPAESYLDTGMRAAFDNAGIVTQLYPNFVGRAWEGLACAPLVVAGPGLTAARSRMAAARRAA